MVYAASKRGSVAVDVAKYQVLKADLVGAKQEAAVRLVAGVEVVDTELALVDTRTANEFGCI